MFFKPYPSSLKSCHAFRWRQFSVEESYNLPYTAGVYVVFYDNKVQYIGSTENLRARMRGHRWWLFKQFPSPEKIHIKARVSIKFGEWLMQEWRLIRRLKPSFNRKGKGAK